MSGRKPRHFHPDLPASPTNSSPAQAAPRCRFPRMVTEMRRPLPAKADRPSYAEACPFSVLKIVQVQKQQRAKSPASRARGQGLAQRSNSKRRLGGRSKGSKKARSISPCAIISRSKFHRSRRAPTAPSNRGHACRRPDISPQRPINTTTGYHGGKMLKANSAPVLQRYHRRSAPRPPTGKPSGASFGKLQLSLLRLGQTGERRPPDGNETRSRHALEAFKRRVARPSEWRECPTMRSLARNVFPPMSRLVKTTAGARRQLRQPRT